MLTTEIQKTIYSFTKMLRYVFLDKAQFSLRPWEHFHGEVDLEAIFPQVKMFFAHSISEVADTKVLL
jgi:hypothetical protein